MRKAEMNKAHLEVKMAENKVKEQLFANLIKINQEKQKQVIQQR